MIASLWAGYMWGENANFTVSWTKPQSIVADNCLFTFDSFFGPPRAVAWVRSVTVKDPNTGAITVKNSNASIPLRIEDNAISVTFALNTVHMLDSESLVHIYFAG